MACSFCAPQSRADDAMVAQELDQLVSTALERSTKAMVATKFLGLEVATTSQMLFCNIIFEWLLAKYSIWLCTGFSVAQNGHFL
jgi:hypothetical protein